MKTALAVVLVSCCLMEIAVARPHMARDKFRIRRTNDATVPNPNFMYAELGQDGRQRICGCWVTGRLEGAGDLVKKYFREVHTQQASYTFTQIDEHSNLNSCTCVAYPGNFVDEIFSLPFTSPHNP